MYIFIRMQGILSLTMPAMRLLSHAPATPVGNHAAASASPSRPALFLEPILENTNQATAIRDYVAVDVRPPARWGLNE